MIITMNKSDLCSRVNNGIVINNQFCNSKRLTYRWVVSKRYVTTGKIPEFPTMNSIVINNITIDNHFMEITPRLLTSHDKYVFHDAMYGHRPDYNFITVMHNHAIVELTNSYIQETKNLVSDLYLNGSEDLLHHISSFLSPLAISRDHEYLYEYMLPPKSLYGYLRFAVKSFHLYAVKGAPHKCILKFQFYGKDVLFEGRVTDESFKFIIDPFNQVSLDSSYSILRLLEMPIRIPIEQILTLNIL